MRTTVWTWRTCRRAAVACGLLAVFAVGCSDIEEADEGTAQESTVEPEAAPSEGDIAICNDGTYSDNLDIKQTCSSHQGVADWLAPYGECEDGEVVELAEDDCGLGGNLATLLPPDYQPENDSSSAAGDGEISAADLGEDAWPFTVSSGTVACSDDAVTFSAEGTTYAINGRAQDEAADNGWVDIYESDIWRDLPDGGGAKISVGPIIDAGLELC